MKDYSKLKRTLCFTDLHVGYKSNSKEHNQRCLDFIDFCCENVEKYSIDFISFLGDYFDNRNTLNVETINYGYRGIQKLNDLGIPIFMIVGNHDLNSKHSRDIHSLVMFKHFSNVTVIDDPKVFQFHKNVLMLPWLFEHEYETIKNYDAEYVFAHLELTGFLKNGHEVDSDDEMVEQFSTDNFVNFTHTISGHFHKKDTKDNVTYIGNPFSTNFGECDDNKGFTVFDLEHNTLELVKFENGPRYMKAKLSEILDGSVTIPDNVNCKIISDVSLEFSELMELKKSIQESRNVLSMVFEELPVSFYSDDVEEIEDTKAISINDAIVEMLSTIKSKDIDNKMLIKIYNGL